jgi:hypothetical protein
MEVRIDFDKVLMFFREPGGGGELIWVQRDGASHFAPEI